MSNHDNDGVAEHRIATLDYNPYLASTPMQHIEEIDELRARFGVFRSSMAQGFVVVTDAEVLRSVMHDPARFSNSAIAAIDPEPQYMLIPEMVDPPEHTTWRRLLAPWFAPNAIERMEADVRRVCVELIEPLVERGGCEFNADFAYRYPTSIFLTLMGLPHADLAQFQHWNDEIHHLPYEVDPDRSRSLAAQNAVKAYFADLMQVRRTDPRDDLVTAAMSWQIDSEPIATEDLLSLYLLMFQAGMDTVASQLAYMWWHLAQNDSDRERVVSDPDVIPRAVEEFIRFYAFVAPSRKATADAVIAGCPVAKGEMLFLPLSAATRDPAAFVDAGRFVIDREVNNHIAFGAGPHRCLGSHLARRELRIALEEWHRRIPNYRVAPGASISEHGGMFGLDSLPLQWG